MRRLSIAVVLLLVAPLACAQVYKWTDAHGTTHYSETPPAQGTKYSQVTVTGSDQPVDQNTGPASSSSASSSSATSQSSSQSPQPVADTPENREKMCSSIKANISTLQGSAPVVIQGQSNQQVLNADQRKQQLDASQSQFDQYCAK